MNQPAAPRMADWRAAIIAGFIAGLAFLLINMALASSLLANPKLPFQLAGSLVLGPSVLPPTALSNHVLLVGLGAHFSLAVAFTCLIAFCLHRWGIWTGIIGGGLFGLALYSINYYFVADFVPGFAALRGWLMASSHVVFGACAGGCYEALERDHR
ncbi:MAG: hypothetical protein EXR86_13910 [Gammaproteobacteria bacterium]|nr:hypothetical protein [Gammaproteobacteria bacterium]